jgi:hypothetical protein
MNDVPEFDCGATGVSPVNPGGGGPRAPKLFSESHE